MAYDLHSTHFRFGIDELDEATHGWYANEDVNPTHTWAYDIFLLRFNIDNIGDEQAYNLAQQFEYRKNAGEWTAITPTSSDVKALACVALANEQYCTQRLSGAGTFETSGGGQTEDGLSGGDVNDPVAEGCTETECGLQLIELDLSNDDVIEFRVTGGILTITHDVTPSITIGGGGGSIVPLLMEQRKRRM